VPAVRGTADRLFLTAALGALAAPLLAARVLWSPGAEGPVTWQCPLLEATGVPCPACGATRAFVHVVHGDAAFLDYNWAWLLIWAALLGWMLLLVVRRTRRRPLTGDRVRRFGAFLQRRPAAAAALPFVVLAATWLVAVANVGSIRAY
jgi:Protein of unknown function (DUF2752)